MGSIVEINDTLQLTSEQGFPNELNLERHLEQPISAQQFQGRTFSFFGKKGARLYKSPPVRNFLVENRAGKWIYWGLVLVTEETLRSGETSGKFEITYIYTPEEMRKAHDLIDRNETTRYFV